MTEKINYGICMGVRDLDGNIIKEFHQYLDGRTDIKEDPGLCPDCADLYRSQFPEFKKRFL